VLAVGDAEFQKKCLGKMEDVSKNEGRTVLFVSHNMPMIQKLCTQGLMLKNGQLKSTGDINRVIENYMINDQVNDSVLFFLEKPNLEAYVIKAEILDEDNNPGGEFPIGKPWKVVVQFKVNSVLSSFVSSIGLLSANDIPIKTSWQEPLNVSPGVYESIFEEKLIHLSVGQYKICIGLSNAKQVIQFYNSALKFEVIPIVESMDSSTLVYDNNAGLILNSMKMETRTLK
jgi:lipopolysaccharide transport system ATP-binding protein